jgi:hypothetical protein
MHLGLRQRPRYAQKAKYFKAKTAALSVTHVLNLRFGQKRVGIYPPRIFLMRQYPWDPKS